MDPVVHFGMGDYVLASTTGTSPQGRPKTPGAINGGFLPKKPEWGSSGSDRGRA